MIKEFSKEEEEKKTLGSFLRPFAQGVMSDILGQTSTSPSTRSSSRRGSSIDKSSSKEKDTITPAEGSHHKEREHNASPAKTKSKSNSYIEGQKDRVNRTHSMPVLELESTTNSTTTGGEQDPGAALAVGHHSEKVRRRSATRDGNSPKEHRNTHTPSSKQEKKEHRKSSSPRTTPFNFDNQDELSMITKSPRKVDGKMVITAGSIDQLITQLADEKIQDKEYLEQFLFAHKYFIDSITLFQKLIDRFMQPECFVDSVNSSILTPQLSSSPNQSRLNSTAASGKNSQIYIQLRTINVIKKWIELNPDDFEDPVLAERFNTAMTQLANINTYSEWIVHLVDAMKRKKDNRTAAPEFNLAKRPKSLIPKTLSKSITFMDVHPTELARQMTLIEHDAFRKIQIKEYYHKAWANPTLAPGIVQFIHRFNNISFWVASEVVIMPNHKQRTMVISRFAELAQALLELGNFNGLMEILSGLNMRVVQRLQLSWKAVPVKTTDLLKQLNDLMDPLCNWQNYRNALRDRSLPILPFQGIYLTDLTFIEENVSKLPSGLINFEKMSMLGKIFSEIRKFQSNLYNLERIPQIIEYAENLKAQSEDELWTASKMCEPSQENLD